MTFLMIVMALISLEALFVFPNNMGKELRFSKWAALPVFMYFVSAAVVIQTGIYLPKVVTMLLTAAAIFCCAIILYGWGAKGGLMTKGAGIGVPVFLQTAVLLGIMLCQTSLCQNYR